MKRTFRTDTRPYSMPKPPEPPELNYIPSDCLLFAKSLGLRSIYAGTYQERARVREQLYRIWAIFGTEIEQYPIAVCGVYLFDARECTGDFAKCDGMCSYTQDRAIIGLDASAIRQGKEYTAFLILHELSHAAAGDGGHSPHYEAHLDRMIAIYNQQYETEIQNDYVTFNDKT